MPYSPSSVQGVSVDDAVNEADKKIQAIYKKHGVI